MICAGAIAWHDFDWPSFATLVTGSFAVAAAYFVGRAQVEIQRRQLGLQEANLRSDLFDRRYRVFERTEQFLREILQHADDPARQTESDFTLAMGEARFLFPPAVHQGLVEIYRN